VFGWDSSLLPHNENLLFYLSQPTKTDSFVEVGFIRELKERLKIPVVIKLHPLTSDLQIANFENIASDISIIHSQIPAELFIMNLVNCVVVSLSSTSFFYYTPGNRYYYTTNIFQDKIRRLRRYKFSKSPAPHIMMVAAFDDIK
jgi:hypothetical protein